MRLININSPIQRPTAVAIDWISGNIFIGDQHTQEHIVDKHGNKIMQDAKYGRICVCKLDGSFLYNLEEIIVHNVTQLAVDHLVGHVYYIDVITSNVRGVSDRYVIGGFDMRKSRFTLADSGTYPELDQPSGLTIDSNSKRIYWINKGSGLIQYFDQEHKSVKSMNQHNHASTTTYFGLAVYQGHIYYGANHTLYRRLVDDGHLASVQEETVSHDVRGGNGVIIYRNRPAQPNGCFENDCAHICLPLPDGSFQCACSAGYAIDAVDSTRCVAPDNMLIYASDAGLAGFPLSFDHEGRYSTTGNMLPIVTPLENVFRVSGNADKDLFVVANQASNNGAARGIAQMWRDGSHSKVLVSNVNVNDLAVDWLAGHIYWTGSDSISVVPLNDTRYYVVLYDIESPNLIEVAPNKGKIFWTINDSRGGINSAGLDGSAITQLLSNTGLIQGMSLDLDNHSIYGSITANHQIVSVNMDGTHAMYFNIREPLHLIYFSSMLYGVTNK